MTQCNLIPRDARLRLIYGLNDPHQQAAPFTVRSTPDFRNTNGMEQKTVT